MTGIGIPGVLKIRCVSVRIRDNPPIKMKILVSCSACKKQTSIRGLAPHWFMAHQNGTDTITPKANAARRGKPSWNYGKKLSKEHIAHLKESIKAKGKRTHNLETKTKISTTAKLNGLSGGIRKGGGRGKKGYYKGIYCDSSWELAYLIHMLALGKTITRVTTPRNYIFEGRNRKYYPDFCVNGIIVEIKGWHTPQSEAKQLQNKDVVVIGKEEIQTSILFAKEKYGNDITKAYDN